MSSSLETDEKSRDLSQASPDVSTDEALSQLLEPVRPLLPSRAAQIAPSKKPEWLKIQPPAGERYQHLKGLLKEQKLNTVCQEARCPNVAECWSGGTATVMLGGEICTRACRFCAVKTARRPPPLDAGEPLRVASSIAELGLKYVVLTSVDRDDLLDGGAAHFAETIQEIKKRDPRILVEALVPDFRGRVESIQTIVDSRLDVYAHNLETVRRYHARVRDPRAGYDQSLKTLKAAREDAQAKGHRLFTKSALMVGFGETQGELCEAFEDLRENGVEILTVGQYLRPSLEHLPVERYWKPEEFNELEAAARKMGFLYVAAGPLVRSSYRAAELFLHGLISSNPPRKETAHAIQTS